MFYIIGMLRHMAIRILEENWGLLYPNSPEGCLRFLLTYFSQGCPAQSLPCFIRAIITRRDIDNIDDTTF